MLKKLLLLIVILLSLGLFSLASADNILVPIDPVYNYIKPYAKQMPTQAFVIGTSQSFEEFVNATGSREFKKYVVMVLNNARRYDTSKVFFSVWKDALQNKTFASRAIALAGINSASLVYHEMNKSIINSKYIVVVVGNDNVIHDMALTIDTKNAQAIYRNPHVHDGNFVREPLPDWKGIITSK